FTGIGKMPARTNPGGAAGGQAHQYDDGYVLVDSSGNLGGQTWNWGYSQNSQVKPGSSSIDMHSSSAQGGADSGDINNNPQYGFEIVYSRELGRMGWGRWGVEAALGYTAINLRDNRTLSATVHRVTDAYGYTAGTTPPSASFQGTFDG